ncbi:glycerol-3-phosphate dehydrogenase [Rhodobacter xanthinilyticus]|uniref:Glycerol-3-phosphate dehydrogenase n=1 Tax=Rhodobacter xanthinilyticus TaxID=1850250 RepID=A0A1D9M9V1_9RHOB|nr:FAD-binding oxidoreductase [Rhodobacter xanthinilyticus]AOZ68570.1 glycerol-3-phosphate dehydrogenase [Rhodobacter xanthinilyticus]
MTHDFLIIGGGVAGLSAAARLAPEGALALLEAEEALGYHASGRSAALYEPHYGNPAVVALSLASGEYYHGSGLLSPRGVMFLDGPDQGARFRTHVAEFALTELSLAEARGLFPILNPETVGFAAHAPSAWDIDTDAYLQRLARETRAAGGEIITRARVERITRLPGGWEIAAGERVFRARVLINAAGAWVDRVAALAGVAPLGFTPLRRSMARISLPAGLDPATWPMVIGGAEEWYCKPDAGALIVSPAEEDPAEPHDAFADDMVLAEGLARYEAMVSAPVTRMIANWAGLRTFSPDRAPVIGFAPAEPGFFWLAGQGGYGFQSAPAASALAAALLCGRAPDLAPEIVASVAPGRLT